MYAWVGSFVLTSKLTALKETLLGAFSESSCGGFVSAPPATAVVDPLVLWVVEVDPPVDVFLAPPDEEPVPPLPEPVGVGVGAGAAGVAKFTVPLPTPGLV